MPDGVYVTDAALVALLGAGAAPDRVTLAVTTANQLVTVWSETTPVGAPVVDPPVPAPVTPARQQAALELAHTLYRRHAAVGGVFSFDEVVARLPADLVRSIRDLLDADRRAWGIA